MIARFTLITLATLTALFTMSARAQPVESGWDPFLWNPPLQRGVEAPEDAREVVLPLPCGGAMVFLQIVTDASSDAEAGSLLADRRVLLGRNVATDGFIDYTRAAHVAGPFLSEDGRRYFLLGKFEVSRAQYDAVMADDCVEPSLDDGAFPAVEVSWYDAVAFTRRLNAFWYAEHADVLPGTGGAPGAKGFARLPTEAEWEFAARGGLVVSEAEFEADRFPMSERLAEYAFYGDTASAQELNEIGLLRPNPLGLRDILGNAAEMVFEPFRMNRAGRLHGLAGGFIAKGGSFLTEREQLAASARIEYGYFNAAIGREQANDETGFRVAISAQALGALTQINRMREAWTASSRDTGEAAEDPAGDLETIADDVADLEVRNRINRVRAALVTALGSGLETRGRQLRTVLRNAGFLHQQLCALRRDRPRLEKNVESLRSVVEVTGSERTQQALDRMEDELSRVRLEMAISGEVYADTLVRTRTDYPAAAVAEEAATLATELQGRNRRDLARNVRGFVATMEAGRQAELRQLDDLLALIDPDDPERCRV